MIAEFMIIAMLHRERTLRLGSAWRGFRAWAPGSAARARGGNFLSRPCANFCAFPRAKTRNSQIRMGKEMAPELQ